MSQFKRAGRWVSKFQVDGVQRWTPGGPWATKQEAADAEHEYRKRLRAEVVAGPKRWTCREFSEVWLSENEPRWASTTYSLYEGAVRRFNVEHGDRYLDAVTRRDAKSWSASVTRSVSRVISTMFSAALDDELIQTNPFARMGLAKKPSRRREAPSLEDYRATLLACGVLDGFGPEFQRMVKVSAWTGIRQGELFGLQWQDVDIENGLLWVRRARKTDGTLGSTKNGEDRQILWPNAREVLAGHDRRAGSPFVFHTARGNPLTATSFYYYWNPVRKAAGVKWRWHDWRHFCATRLLEAGVDHFAVSVQLGHEDGGQLVMERYGHPSAALALDRLRIGFAGLESGSETGSVRHDRRFVSGG